MPFVLSFFFRAFVPVTLVYPQVSIGYRIRVFDAILSEKVVRKGQTLPTFDFWLERSWEVGGFGICDSGTHRAASSRFLRGRPWTRGASCL
jgi:hypothetical protein